MGILFTILMGFLFTITMGFLFTIVLGIQLTISKLSSRGLGQVVLSHQTGVRIPP